MATITAGEIRNRLRTYDSVELTDPILEDAAFITAAEAMVNVILEDNSMTYAGLSTNKQALAKAAMIEWAAMTVLDAAPEDDFAAGPTNVKRAAKDKAVKSALDRFNQYISRLGCAQCIPTWTASGGDAYAPDGEDLTNINIYDTEDSFSLGD